MRKLFIAAALLSCATVYAANKADPTGIKAACQKFAEKELIAPATAKFESLATVELAKGADSRFADLTDTWRAYGYVDSQNSFGAMLRTQYLCTVQITPNKTVKLLDMFWLKGNL